MLQRHDGAPWLSPWLIVEPDRLYSVSGWAFEDADVQAYDTWHANTNNDIKTFLTDQYNALKAPL